MSYRLPSTASIYAFSPDNVPALTVPAGSVVAVDTCDCFADQLQTPADTLDSLDWARINPATGPVFVEGAKPGGVLKIAIQDIAVGPQGVMATGKDLGVLGDRFEGLSQRFVPLKDGAAVWDADLSIPLDPMIGVIGVAPASGAINCGTPGSHGGNMDNRLIRKGATLYVPVFVEGALFACGDLHAVMGDGEVCVCGVEVAGTVTARLDPLPDLHLKNPVLEDATSLMTIASAETLDEAVSIAVGDMADLLVARLSMALDRAIMLMSITGDAQICQVVDPLKTARFVMPKRVLDALGFVL